jgi:type I restriction enzyme S subunit
MKELCEITSSKRIFAADYQPEGIPFYRGKEITEKHKGNLDVTTELFIDPEKFEAIRKKYGAPLPGDLLLTSVGTLGSPYVVRAGETFYFKDGNLTWFRKLKGLDSKYLYYWLLSPSGRAELKKCTIGSSQSAYTIVLLKDMEIHLPDLPTQRKIAGILSAYDDLIENNLRRIKILEEMAQSLYREWFVHFRFPGHESAKFVDSSLGQIPKGWELKTLDELTEVILDCRGKTPKKLGGDWSDEGIVALSALNVKTGHLIKMDQAKNLSKELYSKWMKTPLKRHDVLLTSEAPLGECYLLPDDTPYCLSQRLFALRANPEMISPALLFYSLISEQGQACLQNRATGTTVRGIRQAALREVEILVPDQKIRELAGAFFEGTAAQLANLHRRNQTLRHTRDILLPKLLNGDSES